MRLRIIHIILAITFFSNDLLSQNEQSNMAIIAVIDQETNEPLPYVNVCFESVSTVEKKYATTDLEGKAINTCTGKCIVALSYVGYKTTIDTIMPEQSMTYKLRQDFFNLEQITITGTRTEKHLKDASVITQVITSQDIEVRGLTSVTDILSDDMPGIDFQQHGYGTDIKIQGLDANYVLFLIDGERMAGESGGNIDYSRLNTANIERIEIVKGASSALYGSQAMGGVINIITKKPRKKIEIRLVSQFKQYNEINFPELEATDDYYSYKRNLDKPNLNNSLSIGLNIGKVSSRTDFIFKSFDAYQLYDRDSTLKEYSNVDTMIYDLNTYTTNVDGYEDYTITQKFDFKFSDKLSATIKGSYYNHNQYDFVRNNTFKKFIDYTFGGNIKYDISDQASMIASYHSDTYDKYNESERTGNRVKIYSHQFKNPRLIFNRSFNKHDFISGVEYLKETLLSDKFSYDTVEQKQSDTYIFFIQDDINITNKINIVAGARGDVHSNFGFHLSPKLSAMYKAKSMTYRANYANGFRSPNLKELYMNWDHLGMFVIKGNENLEPETNNYYSLSAELIKPKINAAITTFHNRFKNKIEGQWAENQTVFQYINVNESNMSGVEINAKYYIVDDFSISSGYSYLYDNTSANGVRLSTVSPHSGVFRMEYRLRKGFYKLTVNLSSKIYGAKKFEVVDELSIGDETVDAIYPVYYSAYSMWKLSINQNLYNGLNIILGIDNIFDYTAPIINFNTSVTPGRRFFVSLDISLDKLYDFRKSERRSN